MVKKLLLKGVKSVADKIVGKGKPKIKIKKKVPKKKAPKKKTTKTGSPTTGQKIAAGVGLAGGATTFGINRYLDRDKRARADETNTKRKLPTESKTKSKTKVKAKVKAKAKSLPDIRDKFKGRGAKSNIVRDKKGFAVRDKSGKAVKRQQNKPKKVGSLFRKKD